ncbi:MAG: hypothetical protein ACK55Z_14870, partial [bacterium]
CIYIYTGARLQLEEEPEPHLKIQGMPEARKRAKALVRALLEREEEEFYEVPVIFFYFKRRNKKRQKHYRNVAKLLLLL